MTLGYLLFSFSGRISRKAYWLAAAILFLAQLVAAALDRASSDTGILILAILISLAAFVSSVAVAAKRWHDRDKSGWWFLIILIPFVGGIWMFVENGCLRGTPGPNRFGPDPLAL